MNSVLSRPRVPVVVLSGGLGSGKTTLLNHILHQGIGRVGVVVNDFGRINVDAFLVRGHVDARAEIGAGCLCCLENPDELDEALAGMADPEIDLDVILVEASGLAEPRALARMILGSQAPEFRFGGVLEIVDAAAAVRAQDDGDELPVAADHIRVASLVVINKADRVAALPDGAARLARLEGAVQAVAPEVPLLRTSYGVIDPALVFDAAVRPEPSGQLSFVDLLAEQLAAEAAHRREGEEADHAGHHHHHHHPHERPVSASLASEASIDPARLVAFLDSRPPGLYRVKGEFWVDAPGRDAAYVVHAVGGWFTFERSPAGAAPSDAAGRRTRIVAVGTGFDEAAVESQLRACLHVGEGPVSEDSLRALDRYTSP